MSGSLWRLPPLTSRIILISKTQQNLALHISKSMLFKWCYGTVTVDKPRCIFTSSLVYDANLWNKQTTMENIWIDMYPYPQDLSSQCGPCVELCILRFLPELDQFLAPHVCKGLHSMICKSISETKVKVRGNEERKKNLEISQERKKILFSHCFITILKRRLINNTYLHFKIQIQTKCRY